MVTHLRGESTALKLDRIVHTMGQAWRTAVMETNAMIFDGSDHSKYLLKQFLADGKMLHGSWSSMKAWRSSSRSLATPYQL